MAHVFRVNHGFGNVDVCVVDVADDVQTFVLNTLYKDYINESFDGVPMVYGLQEVTEAEKTSLLEEGLPYYNFV